MSLRLRLTLLTGLLISVTLFLFALFFYLFLQNDLLEEIDAHLEGRADLVMRALAESTGLGDEAELLVPPPLAEYSVPGLYVQLLHADGRVRAESLNLPDGYLPVAPELLRTAQTGETIITTVAIGEGEELRVLATVVERFGSSRDVLLVAQSLEPMQRTLAQARALLSVYGSVALILATVGAAVLTTNSLAPISRLTETAAAVAASGNYHERLPVPPRKDEVGQLAGTLNELIGTVEQTLIQQRQFIADTSHELRSPLTVVLANLDLLRRDLDVRERELSLQEATSEVQRMRRLVNDLLFLAQTDAAQAVAHVPVCLDTLIDECVFVAARQAPTHVVSAKVGEPVVVIGDRERLTQLLRNLLENAVQHTPDGTRVEVRLRRSDGVAQIAVTDTGPGISAEHLPHVWDRFYRADRARSRVSGSTGLGLSIVKYIAEAHGGRVGVSSEEGKGTTFMVTLPVLPRTG